MVWQVFDLKGSMRGRYVSHNPKKDSKGDVLMDENFLECEFFVLSTHSTGSPILSSHLL